jgi:hypothetical protein
MWLAVGADDPAVGTNVVDQGGTHMRLGKEQAAGYVEDTEGADVPEAELTIDSMERVPLTPAPEAVRAAV